MKPIHKILTLAVVSALIGGVISFAFGAPPVVAVLGVAAASILYHYCFPAAVGSMMVLTLASLAGPNGTEDNIGGTKKKFYYAPVSQFTTITEPASFASATTYSLLSTNASVHVFSTGFCFLYIYITEDSGNVKYEAQGEVDGYSMKPVFTMFYPGSKADAAGFARYCKNDNFICIVPHADGTLHQIGTADFPATIKPKYDSGTNSSGRRGFEFEVSAAVCSGPIIYTAAIPLTPAP